MNEMDGLDAMLTTELDTAKENSALKTQTQLLEMERKQQQQQIHNKQHRLDEIMRHYSEHPPGKDAAGRPAEPAGKGIDTGSLVEILQAEGDEGYA